MPRESVMEMNVPLWNWAGACLQRMAVERRGHSVPILRVCRKSIFGPICKNPQHAHAAIFLVDIVQRIHAVTLCRLWSENGP